MSDYQLRKESGRCTYPGCPLLQGDESLLCDGHRDKARERVKKLLKRKRTALRKEKRCVDCRRPSKTYRCPTCRIAVGSIPQSDRSGENKPQVDARIEGDGYARERFRGQGKRGPQPKHQLDDQDLAAAVKELERARAGLRYAASPEVQELPRAQRQEAIQKAVALAIYGIRLAAQVPARHDVQIPDLSVVEED